MKRYFTYILVTVLSAVSCRKEPVVQLAPEEISFAAPAVAETKSVLITGVEGMVSGTDERAYSVFASRYLPDDMENTHEQFMTNVKVYSAKTDEEWSDWQYDADPQTPENQNLYWSPGAAYKFFAVYPYYDLGDGANSDQYDLGISYAIDEENHALKVTGKHIVDDVQKTLICTGTDNSQNLCPDILYGVRHFAEPYQVGENRGAVNFTMNHALAAVSFRLRNASSHVIKGIIARDITGFKNAADYVLLSENGPVWENPSEGQNLYELEDHVFSVSDVSDEINVGAYYPSAEEYWNTALMIPQEFGMTSASFTFSVSMEGISGNKEYTIVFKDYAVNNEAGYAYTYLPGRRYIYTFNVTSTDITCDVEIVPWVEDEYIELN